MIKSKVTKCSIRFQYYNAEVTGVTQATCVVNFMEYGNYEEVVKEDCLPITS